MANAPVPVPASPLAEKPPQQWELAAQWAQGWRVLKVAASVAVGIAFLMVIGQGYLFYRLFDDIHPVAGFVYIVALTAALAWLVARPVAAFLSMPVAARPPDILIDPKAPDPKAIAARLSYDVRYLKMLAANPEVQAERAAIEDAIAKGKALAARAGRAKPEEALALSLELQTFERAHIEALLAPLDRRVNQIIHAEAVGVGVATAISMNGTVDAFIVLWRNANLVARVSRIYFGRPHLMGSLRILRDVAAIVVAARALEDVTDITGEVVGSLLGRMGGLIAGPVMDGGINAMMTLKLGYLAKRRCRSFKGWTAVQAAAISEGALQEVKAESGSVISDLLKRVGGLTTHASRATERVMAGSRSTWELIRSWFGGGRMAGGA
ncbi:YcjF family protein [Hyphomonas sp. NPDC076900]|uniref:YcjF family protein n=1 Tax=unclassified Hyphomonas TaxID=2630699 RepID=UPI003D05D717